MKKSFYVYEHWRPDKDVCFYVGKGKGRRAYDLKRNNRHYQFVISKLSSLGMCAEVRMVASGLSEKRAFVIEIERIAFWRRSGVKLANKTDGGDGLSGMVHSKETCLKIKLSQIGRPFTPEHREKCNAALKIVMKRPEIRAKLRDKATGRKVSDKTRDKMRQARIGVKYSDETRAKMSASLKKTYESPELRARIGGIHRGKVYSEETREKIRQARLRKILPPKTRAQIELIAAANRGQKRSEETKEKLRAAWVIRRIRGTSIETRKRMSDGQKARRSRDRVE